MTATHKQQWPLDAINSMKFQQITIAEYKEKKGLVKLAATQEEERLASFLPAVQ